MYYRYKMPWYSRDIHWYFHCYYQIFHAIFHVYYTRIGEKQFNKYIYERSKATTGSKFLNRYEVSDYTEVSYKSCAAFFLDHKAKKEESARLLCASAIRYFNTRGNFPRVT